MHKCSESTTETTTQMITGLIKSVYSRNSAVIYPTNLFALLLQHKKEGLRGPAAGYTTVRSVFKSYLTEPEQNTREH